MKRALVLAVASLLVVPEIARTETILRFNLWVPPTHHTHTRMMVPWANDVATATNGRVKIEFTASSLGAPPRQFDLAAEGIADVTFGDHTYSPGRFHLTKMVELPFTGDNGEALSVAFWRTYSAMPEAEKEHEGTKLLSLFANGMSGVMTTKKRVDSLESLRGLKLRVPGEMSARVLRELGAVPISVPAPQVFEVVSQGVVDGATFNLDAYKNLRLDRLMKFVTIVPEGLYNTSLFLVMNRKKWDALPKADQDAIAKVSGEAFARKAGKVWDDEAKISLGLMKRNNVDVVVMDEKLRAQIAPKLAFLRDEWLKEMKKRAIDGERVLQKLRHEYKALKKN